MMASTETKCSHCEEILVGVEYAILSFPASPPIRICEKCLAEPLQVRVVVSRSKLGKPWKYEQYQAR